MDWRRDDTWVILLVCLLLGTMIIPVAKAIDYKYFDKYYEEPVYEHRFNSDFSSVTDYGSGVEWDEYILNGPPVSDYDEGTLIQSYCWNNNEVHHAFKGNEVMSGQDYCHITTRSHKIMIPPTESPYYYSVYLSMKYSCRYWTATTPSFIKSYYCIEGYDSNDVLIQTSTILYIANWDTRDYQIGPEDKSPIVDQVTNYNFVTINQWHQCPTTTLLINNDDVKYIKLFFKTSGTYLYSNDGIDIRYSDINVQYYLFSGADYTQGNPTVTASEDHSQSDVVVTLKGGSQASNDYGTIKVTTPYLYYNNDDEEYRFGYAGRFKLKYETLSWTRTTMILRGYFKIHYYDRYLNFLGTDSMQFIDIDTVHSPYKTEGPYSGINTLYLEPTSGYIAKYVKAEIHLTGSYLWPSDGGSLKFFDLGIASSASDSNIEVMYYYQSNYPGTDYDRTDAKWYLMNYYFNEIQNNRLCILKNQIDNSVSESDFSGTGINDVSSCDFFIFSGHGSTDSKYYLTNGNCVDWTEDADWGPELEFALILACNILSDNRWDDWSVDGLYKNHALLGFREELNYDTGQFLHFLKYMIEYKWTIKDSFETAYSSQPYRDVFDTATQRDSDYFWNVCSAYGLTVQADEYYDDAYYYSNPS